MRMNPLSKGIALAQGLWVRDRIEMLPPAGGPASGGTGSTTAETPLHVGILGESTAAGCGVDAHESGFAGALARVLSSGGRPVEWKVVGEHGATARRIRYRLMPQLVGEFDVVVVLAGANDVLARRSPEQWADDLTAIVTELGTRSGLVIVAGTPPFTAFPSLPRTLRRYLAERGRELDDVSRRVCDGVANAEFVATPADVVDAEFFARDGFHPGEHGYAQWAAIVAGAMPGR